MGILTDSEDRKRKRQPSGCGVGGPLTRDVGWESPLPGMWGGRLPYCASCITGNEDTEVSGKDAGVGGLRTNTMMGGQGTICAKNKVDAGHSEGMWEARKRSWDLPLGVQVILLLRP